MDELTQTVFSFLFRPEAGMAFLALKIRESPSFYEHQEVDIEAYQPRSITVYIDLNYDFKPGMLFSLDMARWLIEHYKGSTWRTVNQSGCPFISSVSILHDKENGHFKLDAAPCLENDLVSWMNLCSEIQKFEDGLIPAIAGGVDYFGGVYKKMPKGAIATQVLVASLPGIGRFVHGFFSMPRRIEDEGLFWW